MSATATQPRTARTASWATVRQLVARHPVAAYLLMVTTITWVVVLPPLRIQGGLPFGLPLWDSLASIVGVALPAFLVTAATSGQAGVRDLASRSVRWRVGARWYLVALAGMPVTLLLGATALLGPASVRGLVGTWPLLVTVLAAQLLLRTVLFNLAEEIGWTGFLQARLQDRHGPLLASVLVTVPFGLFHLPFLFVDSGMAEALVMLPVLMVLHLFARVLIMWLYNTTGRSLLLVGLFHASFNATVATARDLLPGPVMTAFWIATGVTVVTAVVIVVATKGRLSYQPRPATAPVLSAAATTMTPHGQTTKECLR
jgi:membrane protease YdiL (CAAX protease family)